MTQFERFQKRIAQRETNRKEGREPWDNGPNTRPMGDTTVREFDATKWKMTPAARELLMRTGAIERPLEFKTNPEIADEMEKKYGDQLTMYERMAGRFGNTVTPAAIYATIEGMAGRNGKCRSRKTTYRHMKFGRGNISERGYLRSGFSQKKKESDVVQ